MTKLKKSNCDKTKKKLNFGKTQELKLWQNSNKLWQNLKDQIVTKLKSSNCAKLKKNNCSNSKTRIVIVIKMTVVTERIIMTSFSKNTLTPWQPTNFQGSFSQLLQCFLHFSVNCGEKKTVSFLIFNKFLLVPSAQWTGWICSGQETPAKVYFERLLAGGWLRIYFKLPWAAL